MNIDSLNPIRIYFGTITSIVFPVPQGEESSAFKLSIREKRDPNTQSMADATGTVSGSNVTFSEDSYTQEFKRVCKKGIRTAWLEIYTDSSSDGKVFLQREISVAGRAGSLEGQPPVPAEQYILSPSGGTAGQVLKKTATGVEWANESGGGSGGSSGGGVSSVNGQTGDVVLQLPEITLAACSALGYAVASSGPSFSWVDPDDVILNGSNLAVWNQTVLVRKEGNSYPSSASDGVVIATTSAALGNKNYYRDHQCLDTTQESGKTYKYQLFSKTSAGIWNALDANKFTNGVGLSWGQITQFVKAGRGPELFPVGTVFYVDHPEYTHLDSSGIAFRVVGHDQVPAQDETLTHTMCLEMAECLFSVQYDYNELNYALTEDTVAVIGKSYYTLSGSTCTELVEGTDYQVGDPVPMASWYEKNLDGRSDGSNNPLQSNYIQWANSSGVAGNWFSKQTLWDTCSSTLLDKNGFCRFLDSEFLIAVKPAKLITAYPNFEGGGSRIHSSKFWGLSFTQVTGNANYGIMENIQLSFYSAGGEKRKTIKDSPAYINWWLRSPNAGNANQTDLIQSSGSPGNNNANGTSGYSFACIIA